MRTGRDYFALIAEGHTPALTGSEVDLTPSFKVQADELRNTNPVNITPQAGTAGNIVWTIAGGGYAVGDLVRITIVSNLVGRSLYRKSYLHEVQAGATSNNDIAAALGAKIAADLNKDNTPYSNVVVATNTITVTQLDDDKRGLVGYEFTDSAAGTIASVPTATTISEGQPSDLIDKGIDAADINLAAYDTVKITLNADVAIPFIDSKGRTAREIYWFGTPGQGALLVTLINGL